MTSREFCYWLQGHFELNPEKALSPEQTEKIKNHLNLVFYHEIDPIYSGKPEVQAQMNSIHSGNSPINLPSDPEKPIMRC